MGEESLPYWESYGNHQDSNSGPFRSSQDWQERLVDMGLTICYTMIKYRLVPSSPLRTSPDRKYPRHTHNLKVAGSNPAPATKEAPENIDVFGGFSILESGLILPDQHIVNTDARASTTTHPRPPRSGRDSRPRSTTPLRNRGRLSSSSIPGNRSSSISNAIRASSRASWAPRQ